METFQDNDSGYREWIYANMGGYVVSAPRGAKSRRTDPPSRDRRHDDPTPDKVWTSEHIKICSNDRSELEAGAHSLGRSVRACSFAIRSGVRYQIRR